MAFCVCYNIQNPQIFHYQPDNSNNEDKSCSDQNFNALVDNFQACAENSADKMFANFHHHEFEGNEIYEMKYLLTVTYISSPFVSNN